MDSKYDYKVGDKFKSKCGWELSVVEVYSPSAIKVSDELGRTKILSSNAIRTKQFKWTYKDGTFCDNGKSRKPRISVTQEFDSKNYGKFKVMSQEGGFYTVQFISTGYIKQSCSAKNVLTGNICDSSVERYSKAREEMYVGRVFTTDKYGNLQVLEYKSATEIYCKWENTSHIQKFSATQLRNKILTDISLKRSKHPFYVYTVKLDGKIIYIGKGKGDRYLHPNSGRSHCIEMNRLHFQGVVFDVEIIKDCISNNEAEELELSLIKTYEGLWNIVGNREY